ncbi:uncharacterized protein LOC123904057 [Trifolium pratense]|uniref:uncharacterized protein LOC123904057 n=1 Tax=Trifolium pratense TaxID=57577 RepID=UPI001E692977|nr:uncharacterized protein LOC123904057 [Trifolium pratense]
MVFGKVPLKCIKGLVKASEEAKAKYMPEHWSVLGRKSVGSRVHAQPYSTSTRNVTIEEEETDLLVPQVISFHVVVIVSIIEPGIIKNVIVSSKNNGEKQSRRGTSNSDAALDPYYIHPSENPTTVCVTPQLEGDSNYHDELNFIAWERCNNLVHSWLINSMKPQVAESVVYIENAVDVWNDLKERYLQGDRVRVATLYQDISNFMEGSLKVSEFFTEMRALWEELDQFRPLPRFTCPHQCVCAAMCNARMYFLLFSQEERQQNYGVNAQFESKIDDTEASANAVESHSRGYESQGRAFGRGRGYGDPRGNIGYSHIQGGRGRGNPYKDKVCTYGGRNGHIIDICHKKHGYPPNWGFGRGNQGTSQMRATDEGNVSLTKDQYNSLIALLERNQVDGTKNTTNMVRGESSHCYSDGVADTGATDHIYNSLNLFISYHEIVLPISVGLPNGNKIQAHIVGKVKLCDDLVIDKVLFLPDFSVNLLSVSSLVKQCDCTISIGHDLCIIQEKSNMKKIGLANQLEDHMANQKKLPFPTSTSNAKFISVEH